MILKVHEIFLAAIEESNRRNYYRINVKTHKAVE